MCSSDLLHFHGSGVAHDNVAALKWFLAAREAAASSPDGLPVRVYDAEIRSPQVWIALAERPLDHAQAEKARQGARELLTAAAPPPRPAGPSIVVDWLKERAFCGDKGSLNVPENESSLKSISGMEKIVWEQQVENQQVKFLDGGRAVLIHDGQPKFLCTYAIDGRTARLTCPLSAYDVTHVSETEIRMKIVGVTALEQTNRLVQRMRSDVSSCRQGR